MAGGQTLTVERLRTLVSGMTGRRSVQIREDHAAYCVEVSIEGDSLPDTEALTALQQVLHRQKPAHLHIGIISSTAIGAQRREVLWGRMLCVLEADVQQS